MVLEFLRDVVLSLGWGPFSLGGADLRRWTWLRGSSSGVGGRQEVAGVGHDLE